MTKLPHRVLTVALLAAAMPSQGGVYFGATTTTLPQNMIMHPTSYSGSGTTAVTNSVCFNPSTLPSGVTEAQMDNVIQKVVNTFNAQNHGADNFTISNSEITVDAGTEYDLESVLLHELGHCVGLGHPSATSTAGSTGNADDATASRPDAGGSYDIDDGVDNIDGSKDDLRGDNTNIYWFYKTSNDPLAFPSIIDTTTYSVSTSDLPSGSSWPANGNNAVATALGYSNVTPVMTWDLGTETVRRKWSAEDMATLKMARAGNDGVQGTSDDYTIQTAYDASATSCNITISFSSATTSLATCSAGAINNNSTHYRLSGATITLSSLFSWFASQDPNTTLTLTDSPAQTTVGQSYTVNVSVAKDLSGMTGAPSGSVLVSDGSNTCTATLSGTTSPATGSCTMAGATTTGTKTLSGTYYGHLGFDASYDTEDHLVGLPVPTVTVSDTPDPSTIGASYTVSATISGTSGTPTGTVSFSDGLATCGPVTLSSGTGSCSITSTTGGSKTITATYSGDTNYSSTTGTTSHTVSKYTPTITITESKDPTAPGESFTITTAVSGGTLTATGIVTVELSDGAGCSITLSSGTGNCSRSSSSAAGFTITITATYEGDTNYNTGIATASHSLKDNSTTTITSDTPDPSTRGSAYNVGFTVVNSTTVATEPTGSVTVSDGTDSCTGTLTAGTNQSTGSCSLTSTTAGTKTLTATYAATTTINSSSDTETHTVSKSTPTVTVTSSGTGTVGTAYSASVTVAGTSVAPTGSVTISDGSASCTIASLTASSANGTGSCNITSTTAGTKTLTANYAGDTNYNSASGTVSKTINKATPSVTVTDATDPTIVGSAYTVSSTVSLSGGATPTGTVTISDATNSCTITLASGTGNCSLTSSTAGSKTLTATYNGDTNYNTASNTTAHTVNKGTPTVTVTDAIDPTNINAAYSVSVTVALSGGAAATGSVTISDGSATCSIASLSSGIGSCGIISTTAGTKTLTANYAGDTNYNSATGTTTHTVSKTTPTVLITSSGAGTVGIAYTVNAVVSGTSPTPTGAVNISDGSNSCSATLSFGAGSCSLTSTTAGTKTLTGNYTGDSNFNTASDTESKVINKATPTVTVSDAVDPTNPGSAYAVNVTVSLSGSVSPSGTLTVSDGTDACTTGNLSAGAASCDLTSTTTGSKTLTASYAGDSNFNAASGTTSHTVNKLSSSVTIADVMPDVSTINSNTVVSVSVSGSGTNPTGSVLISYGGVSCTASLGPTGSAASGSCTLSNLPEGTGNITANYAGDSTYESSTTSASHTVTKLPVTVTIGALPSSSIVVGGSVLVSVTTVGTSPLIPTGTVTISRDEDSANCVMTLAAGAGSCTLSSTRLGDGILIATYSGDANHTTAISSTAPNLNVAQQTPTLAYFTGGTDVSPIPIGNTYTGRVRATGAHGLIPTGTITVQALTQGTSCTFTLVAETISSSGFCDMTAVLIGADTLRATYSGDANFVGGVIEKAITVDKQGFVLLVESTTPASPVVGPVSVNVQYFASKTFDLGGAITVTMGSSSCQIPLPAQHNDAANTVSCSLTAMQAGNVSISASYLGSAYYSSASTSQNFSVGKATPSINDESSTNSVLLNQSLTQTFEVTGQGATPTGSITLSLDGQSCNATLNANGEGTCSLTATQSGARTLTISYSGDANYNATSTTKAINVTLGTANIAITGTTPSPMRVGEPATLSVAVSGNAGTVTGTVAVSAAAMPGVTCVATLSNGIGSCTLTPNITGSVSFAFNYNGDVNYGPRTLSSNLQVVTQTPSVTVSTTASTIQIGNFSFIDVAAVSPIGVGFTGSFTVRNLTTNATCAAQTVGARFGCNIPIGVLGINEIRAEFAGDAIHQAVNSTTLQVTGIKRQINLLGETTAASSLGSPYTVLIAYNASSYPFTGVFTVTDGQDTCTINFGTRTPQGNSTQCALTPTQAGTRTVTVSYSGDAHHQAESVNFQHTVNKAAPVLNITNQSQTSTTSSQAYTVSVSITGANGALAPSGNLTISDDQGAQCVASISNGIASCALTSTVVGARTLTANYAGDNNYLSANSAEVAHTVVASDNVFANGFE